MTARNITRTLAALLLALFLSFCVSIPAFADDQEAASPAAQQVNVSLVSDEEKLAGCHYKAYKLVAAEFNEFGVATSDKVAYEPGVDAALIDPSDPTFTPQSATTSQLLANKGTSSGKWEYLRGLSDRVTSSLAPVADVVVDTGAFTLPGTGCYLFVMDNYQNIGEDDEYLMSPSFTVRLKADEEIEILLKPQPVDLSNWGWEITGQIDHRATLTAIYQPDNIPEDVRVAAELAEQEQKEAMEKEQQGGGLAFSFLPIVLIVGGVVALNVLMKSQKKKSKHTKKSSTAQKDKPAMSTRKEAPQPTEETPASGDDVKVLSGSRSDG